MTSVVHLVRGGWRRSGDTWVRGEPEPRLGPGSPAQDPETRPLSARELEGMRGRFALVLDAPTTTQLATDRVRSIPLWYAKGPGGWIVSDDARWIADQLPAAEPDPVAEAELRLAGYVTGRDTLHPMIKQVQAAELVTLATGSSGQSPPTSLRYAAFLPVDHLSHNPKELLASWDATLERVFQRLIGGLGSRQILIPLSGGGDSRTIAARLKELGRDNVICFSYGLAGNAEAERSREVARALGIRWTFVPYDPLRWQRWSVSEEFAAYWAFGDGLTSIPHVQDWPAVAELRRRGELADDAVFIPGHALDFLAGSHIPNRLLNGPSGRDAVAGAIDHEHLHGFSVDTTANAAVRDKLFAALAELPVRELMDGVATFEYWDWQERQAKFIANAVRVYEFWSYDWRLPYWDAEIMTFWAGVPLELRNGGRLLSVYLEAQNKRLRLPAATRPSRLRRAAHLLPDAMREVIARRLRRVTRRRQYARHPMGWYGMIPWPEFERRYTGVEDINSFLALSRRPASWRRQDR